MWRVRLLIVLAGSSLLQSGCTREADVTVSAAGLTQVRLALNWYPEAEHGGFIAADVHGFYAAEKLSVEIIPGDPGAPQAVIAELAAGRLLFAVSDADNIVKARAKGVPLVAVIAPLQTSPRCIMVHEASGIESLQELANVELAISESRPFALWMKKQLPLSNVRFVPFSGGVGEFLTKPDFAQQGFVFSEPFVAREKGGDPRVLMVSDLGFNPYASLLVTTEKVIQEHPDLVQSMVNASVQGWQQFLVDPQQTNASITAQNGDMSAEVLQFGAEQMVALCRPADGQALCSMTLERWQDLVRQIEEIDEIPVGSVDAEKCFTTKFAENAASLLPPMSE